MDFEEVSELLKLHGYKVIETLGKGGFGECLKVYSDYYKQYFACKVVSVECDKKLKKVQASTAEIDMLTHVIHPNIICIFQTIKNEHFSQYKSGVSRIRFKRRIFMGNQQKSSRL